jgi:hypothetical protein
MINGERSLPDLISLSPMGEFVTCRALYRLIVNNLVEVAGKRENTEDTEHEDEEEVVLGIIFKLYSNCFYQIRARVQDVLGGENSRFTTYAAKFRTGLTNYFPGVDPKSDLMPAFDKFLAAVRAIPQPIRYHTLMEGLEKMLSEQLFYLYRLLGAGAYREAMTKVKMEISEPLASRRELVKRYRIEEDFYGTVKRADGMVKMVRGAL